MNYTLFIFFFDIIDNNNSGAYYEYKSDYFFAIRK